MELLLVSRNVEGACDKSCKAGFLSLMFEAQGCKQKRVTITSSLFTIQPAIELPRNRHGCSLDKRISLNLVVLEHGGHVLSSHSEH